MLVDNSESAGTVLNKDLSRAALFDGFFHGLAEHVGDFAGVELKRVAGDGSVLTNKNYINWAGLDLQNRQVVKVLALAPGGGEPSGLGTGALRSKDAALVRIEVGKSVG